MNDWCIEHHSAVRTLSLRANIHKQVYLYIVWPDRCVPRVKEHDRVGARGNIAVYQKMDPFAAISHARWKLCARGPRLPGKGDARNRRLATLSVSGLRVSSPCTVH
jgi:hypothetical protein